MTSGQSYINANSNTNTNANGGMSMNTNINGALNGNSSNPRGSNNMNEGMNMNAPLNPFRFHRSVTNWEQFVEGMAQSQNFVTNFFVNKNKCWNVCNRPQARQCFMMDRPPISERFQAWKQMRAEGDIPDHCLVLKDNVQWMEQTLTKNIRIENSHLHPHPLSHPLPSLPLSLSLSLHPHPHPHPPSLPAYRTRSLSNPQLMPSFPLHNTPLIKDEDKIISNVDVEMADTSIRVNNTGQSHFDANNTSVAPLTTEAPPIIGNILSTIEQKHSTERNAQGNFELLFESRIRSFFFIIVLSFLIFKNSDKNDSTSETESNRISDTDSNRSRESRHKSRRKFDRSSCSSRKKEETNNDKIMEEHNEATKSVESMCDTEMRPL
ncbi:hypothetical protein RFI_40182 [Reticulomyxa filosa]|uniref:Uncharacterized protein n=1 Tax=Reticulomyxa filosa TaxID=46433 RepID=X6L717_RETFI|nr:hypothetical protein RFI_40182 [Reticulomyxa filosa]|eukprot:ETN97347.1 hypothetical protein RFI_40182 [Reticulomyxa filosa]